MKRKYPRNLVFLDFDGVCNSFNHGSYLTAKSLDEYGLNEDIVKQLIQFCNETESKIVISSNWRRFPDDGTWRYNGLNCKNPLPKLKKLLGKLIFDTLTLDRHICKSEATIIWFEDNPNFKGNFVIFDDDTIERFNQTYEFQICEHFILTDPRNGLTKEKLDQAKEILQNIQLLNS